MSRGIWRKPNSSDSPQARHGFSFSLIASPPALRSDGGRRSDYDGSIPMTGAPLSSCYTPKGLDNHGRHDGQSVSHRRAPTRRSSFALSSRLCLSELIPLRAADLEGLGCGQLHSRSPFFFVISPSRKMTARSTVCGGRTGERRRANPRSDSRVLCTRLSLVRPCGGYRVCAPASDCVCRCCRRDSLESHDRH